MVQNNEGIILTGIVEESLPNSYFKVKLSDTKFILAYTGGKLKVNKIRILVGDQVDIKIDKYANIARIVRRK